MNYLHGWVLFALGSAFFAGLTAVFGKLGVSGMNSDFATLIRTIVILLITAGIISFRDEWQKATFASPSGWFFLILSGIATGLSWLCYYRALQLGPVAKVAPIDKLSVVFAIFMSVLFLGEKLTWPVALGGVLIVSGAIVIIAFG